MSIMADCTCKMKFGYVFGDYSKSCPRHGSTAMWLEQKREQREAALRNLRQQALSRPVHGGYPDAPVSGVGTPAASVTVSGQESTNGSDVHRRAAARQDAGNAGRHEVVPGGSADSSAWRGTIEQHSGAGRPGVLSETDVARPAEGRHDADGSEHAQRSGDRPTGAPADAGEVAALLPRIDAAIKRIVNGQGCMRIPADPEDPDLVLADCKRLLKHVYGVNWAAQC